MSEREVIYFSIVSHNQTEYIRRYFSDFPKEAAGVRIELMIVDNTGCEDLKRFCDSEGLHYYHDGRRRGFGANHNLAFRELSPGKGDRFVVCNPDIRIEPKELEKIAKNSRSADIYTPLVYFDKSGGVLDNPDKDFPGLFNFALSFATQKRLHYGTRWRTTEPGWISGAFMLFRAEVFEALGGFDEAFFMYCEDLDICYRAKESGYRISVDQAAYIEHNAQMLSRNLLSRNNLWHVRSAFRFALKHKRVHQFNVVKARRKRPGGRREDAEGR